MMLNMVSVKRPGMMVAAPDMWASSIKARNRDKDALSGQMVVTMKENSWMGSSRAMENTTSQMLTNFMKVNSALVPSKGAELKLGMTVVAMRATLKMERKMEKALSHGQMAQCILVAGETTANTASEYLLTLRIRVDRSATVNGLTESV